MYMIGTIKLVYKSILLYTCINNMIRLLGQVKKLKY